VTPCRIACIGSRKTPIHILGWMKNTGAEIVNRGHIVVSGNAPGADQAWAAGGNFFDPAKVELCLPWAAFEHGVIHPDNVVYAFPDEPIAKREHYYKLAQDNHTRWYYCTEPAKKLLARNAMIVSRVDFVLGYLCETGGTRHAFRIAKALGLPTFDVAREEVRHTVERLIKGRVELEAAV
jgi:hypothetical protein